MPSPLLRGSPVPYRPRVIFMRVAGSLALAGLVAIVVPAVLLAADPAVVAGTVSVVDGSPAPGVEVLVVVAGTDTARSTTTDADGAYAVQVEAAVGDVLEIRATGPTQTGEPDEDGCVTSRTPTGRVSLTIEALPLEPVPVVLDGTIESRVCAATAAPDAPHRTPRPDPTPPATDGPGGGSSRDGNVLLALGAMLVSAGGALFVVRGRARPDRG